MKIVKHMIIGSMLCSTLAFAGSNAGFVGLDFGGTLGTMVNLNGSFANVGTGISAGLRGGYQAFFNKHHGIRFYASYLASFNAPSYALSDDATLLDLKELGITHRGDVNVDYLFDFIDKSVYVVGLYAGISAGYVLSVVGSSNIGAITAGLNLGLQATIGKHNRFEFGTKVATLHYLSSDRKILGLYVFIGGNYSILF